MFSYSRTIHFLRKIGQRVLKQQNLSRCMSLKAEGLSMVSDSDIAVITMDKQDNRLNQDFFDTLHDMLDQVEGNPAIKAIITTGQGKFYSNGLDMEWMATLPCKEMVPFMQSFQSTMKRLLLCPVPTLAALNGHTFAGGAVMAFAQDFRVMNAEKGWICFNEVHLNKTFFEFLGSFLSCKIGSGLNVNDALVYGQRFTAEEALNRSLIHTKAAPSDLLEHSMKVLRSYIGKDGFSREALGNVKQHIYRECIATFELHKNDIGFSKQFMTDSQLAELKNLNL